LKLSNLDWWLLKMLEDYLVQQPTAIWNSVNGVWERPATANLFCAHLELFSVTWPISGMTLNGQVFELPTLERLTTDSESLLLPIPEESMFRTPQAKEGEGGAVFEDVKRARGNHIMVRDQIAQLAVENGLPVSEGMAMLPTPNTMDHLPARTPEQKAANKGKGGYANVRETVVNDLMGTPRTSSANSATTKQVEAGAPKARIEDQVLATSWGKFEPAIRRWEKTLDRPAPAPTKPDGKDGAHRLSSKFTEWMMGLPDGWITDCGLSRNEELKACGNGVVPQQAELALRILLEGHLLE
jgi:hypothetical protein